MQSPWAAKAVEAPKATPLNSGFKANHADNNLGYEREAPAHFSAPSDDLLMNSLIMKHAIEGKGADGAKNGKFYMDRYNTDLLAQEVVATHMHLKGAKLNKYVDDKMNTLWSHYDVNGEGWIDADRAPVLLRSLIGDVEINNGLQ